MSEESQVSTSVVQTLPTSTENTEATPETTAPAGAPQEAAIKPPSEDREKQFQKYLAAERKLSKQRRDFESKVADLERRQSEFEAKQKEWSKKEDEWKLYEKDPLRWAQLRNVDQETLAKRMLEPKSALEDRIEQLESELRAERDNREKSSKETEERSKKQRIADAEAQLVAKVDPTKHKALVTVWETDEFPRAVDRALNQIADQERGLTVLEAFQDLYGRLPSDTEIVDYMEQLAQTKLKGWNQQPPAEAPQAASKAATKQASGSKQGPTTLTNEDASQVYAGGTNASTREQRARELAKKLAQEDADKRNGASV